ncbi:HDR047Cp [Eremothecium sinecaudum]|uniref:HDR047Cp n=1 Tax=Eremothecium sinecaudum TaxID=45286 RepID=A0A0X8HSR3_9SACH|nr:HDR047Cp [Eremothecium sinecaudum]AMD20789.1 HDR047Cp [Eremothecium sinecaudum]
MVQQRSRLSIMSTSSKKKLMPKSALLVKKYERQIRFMFIAFLVALTLMFIVHDPKANNKLGSVYGRLPNALKDTRSLKKPHTDIVQGVEYPINDGKRVNAAFVTLARNEDLWALVESIRDVEDRFNRKYGYDWVFFNNVPFSEEFKTVVSSLVSGKAKFTEIPQEYWSIPDFIDKEKSAKAREEFHAAKIPYGLSLSYRHMCRFESGFFWRHPELDNYKWYWRVEPETKLYCDINYDVFRFMEENDKKYGFILSLTEYKETIPTLWETTKQFMAKYPDLIKKDNLLQFISDDNGFSYNGCHFWSNFEIASLDFWRSDAYRTYFDFLDKSGGFFYERWGDAPVHSIAASLFLDKEELHFFDGFGYYHPDFASCPIESSIRLQNQCICDPRKDKTWEYDYFCNRKYMRVKKLSLPSEVKNERGK